MRRWAGQAARFIGRHGGRHGAHVLSEILVGVLVLLFLGAGGIAWRLAQGPWESPVLARALERAAAPQFALTIGHAALVWEGFARGGRAPLDIRLSDIEMTEPGNTRQLAIAKARVTLSAAALLGGRLRVRRLSVEAPSLTLTRDRSGEIRVAKLGAAGSNAPLQSVLAALASPLGGSGPLSALRHVRVTGGRATVIDQVLGATWNVEGIDLAIDRAPEGGIAASLQGRMVVGSATAALRATATVPRGFGEAAAGPIALSAHAGAIVPADLAGLAPGFAPLAAVHVPVTAAATLKLATGFKVAGLDVAVHIGQGTIDVAGLAEPVAAGDAEVTGTPDHLAAALSKLTLAPPGAPVTTVSGHAELDREAGGYALTAEAALDHLRFADLAKLWPKGVGGDNTETWLAGNITAGVARDGHMRLAATIAPDFSAVTFTALKGGITGDDLTVHWLTPIPPVEHVNAQLSFEGPDALLITATSGQQQGTNLRTTKASVAISGLEEDNQFADIAVALAGPAADLLGILGGKRLNLLERVHLDLHGVGGTLAGALSIPHLPLLADLSADDVKIQAKGTTSDLRVAGLVAGRDLDAGNFSFSVDNDGLALDGAARIAGIPGKVKAALDFRAGPPGEITQRATVTAETDTAALAAAGLDTAGVVRGPVGLDATWQQQRDGAGSIAVAANLGAATLTVPELGWRKAAGTAATAQGKLLLAGDRITAIEGLALKGAGIDVGGRLAFAGGRPRLLVLPRLLWEPGTDASLTVGFPQTPQGFWDVVLTGDRFDISSLLKPPPAPRAPATQAKAPPADHKQPVRGPAWTARVRLGRLVTGAGAGLDDLSARGTDDGLRMTSLDATGKARNAPFSAAITRQGAGYALHASAANAGTLLATLGVTNSVINGRLTVTATDPATSPLSDWSGQAEMHEFSVRDQPVLGKLLQAMTLYGVLDALRGQGVVFDTLIAPFRYRDDTLTLSDTRAFSASLGMTAKGTIGIASNQCQVEGTIVPAYFFNTLLGRVPLIGQLFSPEKGGGLFAATYGVHGNCDDPSVGVNPLAALTPGFLRGIFGIFDEPTQTPGAPKAAPETPKPPPVRTAPGGRG